VDEGGDVGVRLRLRLDLRGSDVLADLLDPVEAASRTRRDPEDEPIAPFPLVPLGYVDVGVVSDGPMGLVEDDERDVPEGYPPG